MGSTTLTTAARLSSLQGLDGLSVHLERLVERHLLFVVLPMGRIGRDGQHGTNVEKVGPEQGRQRPNLGFPGVFVREVTAVGRQSGKLTD